jgi:hypothetical protein
VGVTIDEARHDDAAGGIDFDSVARGGEILDTPGGPHFENHAITDKDGAIVDDAEVIEAGSEPRHRSTTQGQKAAGTSN